MKPRAKHKLPFIPTANLVDIAILLIIFYMACSNFVTQQAGTIKLPRSPDIEKVNEPLLAVSVNSAGEIYVQGKRVATAKDVESIVVSVVRDKADDKRNVEFKCDASVARAVFEPVIEAIVTGGGVILAVGEKARAE